MQNRHYVCVPCRYDTHGTDTCPFCGNKLADFGLHFKPPRRNNLAQWKKIALLIGERNKHEIYCFSKEYPSWRWCSCRGWAVNKVLADVKSRYGIRRSRSKYYAREESQYRGFRRLPSPSRYA